MIEFIFIIITIIITTTIEAIIVTVIAIFVVFIVIQALYFLILFPTIVCKLIFPVNKSFGTVVNYNYKQKKSEVMPPELRAAIDITIKQDSRHLEEHFINSAKRLLA